MGNNRKTKWFAIWGILLGGTGYLWSATDVPTSDCNSYLVDKFCFVELYFLNRFCGIIWPLISCAHKYYYSYKWMLRETNFEVFSVQLPCYGFVPCRRHGWSDNATAQGTYYKRAMPRTGPSWYCSQAQTLLLYSLTYLVAAVGLCWTAPLNKARTFLLMISETLIFL